MWLSATTTILWPKEWLSYCKTYVKSLEVTIRQYKLFSAPRWYYLTLQSKLLAKLWISDTVKYVTV